MNNPSNPNYCQVTLRQTPKRSIACKLTGSAVLLSMLAWQPIATAQGIVNDNFDSYSSAADMTAAGWILSSLNPGLVTTTFPAVGTGKGLRLEAIPNAPASAPAVQMWYRTNDYTDFYVAVDIVDWPGTDKNQAMVLFARMTDAGAGGIVTGNLNPAAAQGMICNYDASQYGENPTDRRQGQLQINRVGAGFNTSGGTKAVAEITFVPGRSYRLVFKGVGTLYTAQAYDMHDLTTPLVTLQADVPDDSPTFNGACGILGFSRQGVTGTVDATYDNYYSGPTDPNPATPPALAHSIPGTPVVDTRIPAARWENFHNPASGISFTAKTYTSDVINAGATKLFLNGVDVSSQLVLSANGSSITGSLPGSALKSNTVYAARIEVTDVAGTKSSVNTFWFDTFTEAYLAVAPVKTIEAEDYNYEGGKYQLDPIPVSGIDTNGSPINGNYVGYLDMPGLTASVELPENFVDYRDNRGTAPESLWNGFRFLDAVGTVNDNKYVEDMSRSENAQIAFFKQRQKYAEVGVLEYVVARTEPGEWLNYTRAFAEGNYHVYLRVGSFGATEVQLDQVTSDPTVAGQTTTPLGIFSVPNNIAHNNHTYVPLMSGGTPAVVSLAGTNTVRLTMLGTAGQDNRKLNINYLLFVPAPAVTMTTIFDNFNDGNDTTPKWNRYDPIGGVTAAPATFSFPNGGYRIQAPAPQVPDAGQARAGSFLDGLELGDFYISADLIDFDDTVRQAFGLAARINTPGLGTTGGYLFSWEPGGGTLPGTENGDLDISRLENELPTGQIETEPSGLHLERGKSYRFVFTGKGFELEGLVYELPDTSNPIKRLPAVDPLELYPTGQVGLIVSSQGSTTIAGDATYDNFLATTAEPRLSVALSGGNVNLAWPLIPFRLQNATLLGGPWSAVTSGISQVGDENVYSAPATGGSQYFRLVYP
ncbi:MAG: hypothetical protein IH623_16000 [Verrucomicrobia bacterium]|nr:hypothetical protein [Verrucomicrobiota bacterium]